MTEYRTRDHLRNEYVNLLEIWKHTRSIQPQQCRPAGYPLPESDSPDADNLLEQFDSQSAPASVLFAGMKQALDEDLIGYSSDLQNRKQTTPAFVEFYRKASGGDVFEDMGSLKRHVTAVLKRGAIADKTAYNLFKSALDDGPSHLAPRERSKAGNPITKFEERAHQ